MIQSSIFLNINDDSRPAPQRRKNKISHRGKAAGAIRKKLQQRYEERYA